MTDPDEAFLELVRLSEELGLYDEHVTVCVKHLRYVPCRKGGEHVFSSKPEDVEKVRRYQSG